MDDRYDYKLPSRGAAWAVLIFAFIFATIDVYFWFLFYKACQATNHDVLVAIKNNSKTFALFAGFAVLYLIFSTIANVKLSRCKRFWGRGFGIFAGRFLILLSYFAYAAAIIFLFV